MHHRRFFVPIRLVMLICWASVVRVCHIIDDMGIFILQLFCISQCTYDLYITLQTEPVFHFPRTSLLFCNYGWFLVVTLQAVPGCHTVMMLQWFLLMLTINSSWLSLSSYIGLLFLYFPLQMVLVCHASKSVVFQKGFRFTANDKLKPSHNARYLIVIIHTIQVCYATVQHKQIILHHCYTALVSVCHATYISSCRPRQFLNAIRGSFLA